MKGLGLTLYIVQIQGPGRRETKPLGTAAGDRGRFYQGGGEKEPQSTNLEML